MHRLRLLRIGSLSILFALLFSGCGLRVAKISPGEELVAKDDKSIIFAKIVFVENGEEIESYNWRSRPCLIIYHIEKKKILIPEPRISPDNDRYLCLRLPTGTYVVTHMIFGYKVQPQIAFQVPSAKKVYYLGTLKVDASTGSYSSLLAVNNIEVSDQYDEAKKVLANRNPGMANSLEKRLMVHDRSIPIDPHMHERDFIEGMLGDILQLLL